MTLFFQNTVPFNAKQFFNLALLIMSTKTKMSADDEHFARKLQAQFDREAQNHQKREESDRALAHAIARKAHSISDSEDSASTVDPQDRSELNGSPDLFEDTDDQGTSSTSNKSVTDSSTTSGHCSTTEPSESHSSLFIDPYDADTDVEEDTETENKKERKPVCKYGNKCYRKNPSHLEEFYHPRSRKREREELASRVPCKKLKSEKEPRDKTPLDVFTEFQPLSLFLTKVSDIPSKFNSTGAMNLKDILSKSMGELKASCHFNFMFDIPWLVKQYPEDFRTLPVLLVHGEQGRAELDMKVEAQEFDHVTLCRAPLEIPYGTHHTKMMLLVYKTGMRVVIHTANLIQNDWHQKTQGIWVSPLFPPLGNSKDKGDSPTRFKTDLLEYLAAYKSAKLAPWERHIQAHDMSSANVYIIGSVPGRHTLNSKHKWGHLKLKKILSERGTETSLVKNWPVVGQFSSIGSLGANKDVWLLNELGQSLSAAKGGLTSSIPESKLHLIFPSKDNIRLSLEGYNGGGCVPYSIKTASKQPWLTPFFCQWLSEGRGRSRAVPHIKTYTRFSPDGSQAAWFLVTSANLSKAAWGVLEKKGSQLMIRSYELGVLFLPQHFGCKNAFTVSSRADDIAGTDKPVLPLPYDLPPTTYVKGDRPWFCDVPCMDLPDTFGTMWCPPL